MPGGGGGRIRLPRSVQKFISEAEQAEAAGDAARALKCYNDGIAAAMEQLDALPELRPVLEQYLIRALELQPHAAAAGTSGGGSPSGGRGDVPGPQQLAVGDRCFVAGRRDPAGGSGAGGDCAGTVMFYGDTELGPGAWAGVALDAASGSHDGVVRGHRYFSCRPGHGLMIKATRVHRAAAAASAAAQGGGHSPAATTGVQSPRAAAAEAAHHSRRSPSPGISPRLALNAAAGSPRRSDGGSRARNSATRSRSRMRTRNGGSGGKQSRSTNADLNRQPPHDERTSPPADSGWSPRAEGAVEDFFSRGQLRAVAVEAQAESHRLALESDQLLGQLRSLQAGQAELQSDASIFRNKMLDELAGLEVPPPKPAQARTPHRHAHKHAQPH